MDSTPIRVTCRFAKRSGKDCESETRSRFQNAFDDGRIGEHLIYRNGGRIGEHLRAIFCKNQTDLENLNT